jgi:hypothetical protein
VSTPAGHWPRGGRAFLDSLEFPHWALLAYPVFMVFVARRRDANDVFSVDPSAMMQIGFVALLAIASLFRVILRGPRPARILFAPPVLWLTAYGLLAAVSAAWSSRPDFTLYRAGEMLVFLWLAADAVGSARDDREMVHFQMLYGLVLAVFWHFADLRYGWSLAILHNSLVTGANIGVLFLFAGLKERSWGWWAVFGLLALSLLLGTSSASYISLLMGIAVVLLFHTGSHRTAGALIASAAGLLVWGYGLDYGSVLWWGKNEYAVTSASGRIPVWRWLLDAVISQRPILGYGFGVGENIARLAVDWTGLRMQHTHNVALSALVNLGAVGLALFAVLASHVAGRLRHLRRYPAHPYAAAALAAMVVNALSMSSITAPVSLSWISHALVFLFLARVTRRREPVNMRVSEPHLVSSTLTAA